MYDANEMRSTRVRGVLTALVLGAAWLLACPADARAASRPPSNLSVDATWRGRVDLEWRQLPAVLKAIAIDIDRDGDLDVVGSTVDQPLVVWINDGTGRLTRQQPRHAPLVIPASRDTAFPADGRDVPSSTPASPQSPVLVMSEARAPPAPASCAMPVRADAGSPVTSRLPADPRGPPLL